jgi:hypothetical protein
MSDKDTGYMEMDSTTSPWTELYAAESPAESPARGEARAQTTSHEGQSDADRPTHDALTTIFYGDWEGVLFSEDQESDDY